MFGPLHRFAFLVEPCVILLADVAQAVVALALLGGFPASTVAMAPMSLSSLPPDVMVRLHIFLGVQLGPIFARAARFALPKGVVEHARAQLELLELFLQEELRCPYTFTCPLRMYAALCKTAVDAIAAPFLAVANQEVFYPGILEAAHADLYLLRYWDASGFVGPPRVLRPPPDERLDLGDYLAVDLALDANPLTALVDLNADDSFEFRRLLHVVDLLEAQEFTYEFYHPDPVIGRPAQAYLNFCVFGVRGTLVIEEPDVDPTGGAA